MDLSKLVALLHSSQLRLTQVACFDDPFEGHYPPRVRNALFASYTAQMAGTKTKVRPEDVVRFSVAAARHSLYVNCWCLQSHESEALWRIYGGASGIALRTPYLKLAAALPSDTFVGQVTYVDPSTEHFPNYNFFTLAMCKRHFYKHEAECRIVKWHLEDLPGDEQAIDARFGRYPKGISIPIDVREAITDVVVSPLAPAWLHDSVVAVVERFAPGLPVIRSEMAADPLEPAYEPGRWYRSDGLPAGPEWSDAVAAAESQEAPVNPPEMP